MTQVKCPKCGYTNVERKPTCARCGEALPQVRMVAESERRAPAVPAGPVVHTFRRGQIIAKRYTIVDLVGRGGMGCIYRVQDRTLNEEVALKTLLPQFLTDKLVVERFFNEARIARQLSHPNIVRVHDIGMADSVLYISMEYLRGRSLRTMIDQLTPGQRLPVTTTLQVMLQLCAALEYAHQYTVHRDIKPENVMIMDDGSVKLMDFGISKLMTSNKLTATSVVMGTPHYMSPEQIKDSSAVDARADIYSIGVMLYEILTGNLPTGVPKPASQITMEVPPSLDTIVAKCVEPDPKDRYQTIRELKAALRSVLTIIEEGTDFEQKGKQVTGTNARGPIVGRIVGVVLVLVVLLLTSVGLKGVEQRRKELMSNFAEQATPTPEITTEQTAEHRVEALLRAVRDAKLSVDANKPSADMQPVIDQGNSLLRSAETEAKEEGFATERVERFARLAAECFVAALPTRPPGVPPDALFVPPSDNFEDGLFVDPKPVTLVQFTAFALKVDWRPTGPGGTVSGDAITGVTYYDAAAYAAVSDGRLPTDSEWKRAFAAHSEEMISTVYEWTSTPASAEAGDRAPTFGDRLVIEHAEKGADDKAVAGAPETMGYDEYLPTVGFRCVHDIPTDPQTIESLLPK